MMEAMNLDDHFETFCSEGVKGNFFFLGNLNFFLFLIEA